MLITDTEQDITTNRPRRTWLERANTVGSIPRPYVPRSLATETPCRALVGLIDDGRTKYRSSNLVKYVVIRVFTCSFINIYGTCAIDL